MKTKISIFISLALLCFSAQARVTGGPVTAADQACMDHYKVQDARAEATVNNSVFDCKSSIGHSYGTITLQEQPGAQFVPDFRAALNGGGTAPGFGAFANTNGNGDGAANEAHQAKCESKLQSVISSASQSDTVTSTPLSGVSGCSISVNGTVVSECRCASPLTDQIGCADHNFNCRDLSRRVASEDADTSVPSQEVASAEAASAACRQHRGNLEDRSSTVPGDENSECLLCQVPNNDKKFCYPKETVADTDPDADPNANSGGSGNPEGGQGADPNPANPTAAGDLDSKVRTFLTEVASGISSAPVGKAPGSVNFIGPNTTVASPGSLFGKCEQHLDISWSQLQADVQGGANEQTISSRFGVAYAKLYQRLASRLENLATASGESSFTPQMVNTAISQNLSEAKSLMGMVQKCTAMAFMTDKVDYDDIEATDASESKKKKKSFDGKIVAKKNGAETQDYPACDKAINLYNGAFIGKQAMNIGQQFQFQEASMDAQETAMQNQDDITSGMKAQQEMVDEQKKIMDARTAFEGAKGAALYLAWEGIPTKEDLINSCKQKMGDATGAFNDYNRYIDVVEKAAVKATLIIAGGVKPGIVDTSGTATSATRANSFTHIGSDQTSTDLTQNSNVQICGVEENKICSPGVASTSQSGTDVQPKVCTNAANDRQYPTSIAMNEVSCRQAIFKAMTDAGVEMATNMLKSKLLDDQSDKIGDAIANVKSFDEANPAPQFEELNTDICQVDPAAPECAGVDPVFDRGRGFSGNGINVSGFQRAGTNTSLGTQADREFDTGEDSEKEGRGKGVNGIGTTIGAPTNSTAFTDNIPGAAGMKKGGGGAGGGGGGGGGVGAAASSGGGGGGVGGGGGSRSFAGSNGKRVSFSGSGKGSLSFGGGRGGRGKSNAKKGGNPFSKFFKNKKGKKGKTLNFRGVASVGKKKDSLFGMISSRYNAVSKERLLQYKKEEANK